MAKKCLPKYRQSYRNIVEPALNAVDKRVYDKRVYDSIDCTIGYLTDYALYKNETNPSDDTVNWLFHQTKQLAQKARINHQKQHGEDIEAGREGFAKIKDWTSVPEYGDPEDLSLNEEQREQIPRIQCDYARDMAIEKKLAFCGQFRPTAHGEIACDRNPDTIAMEARKFEDEIRENEEELQKMKIQVPSWVRLEDWIARDKKELVKLNEQLAKQDKCKQLDCNYEDLQKLDDERLARDKCWYRVLPDEVLHSQLDETLTRLSEVPDNASKTEKIMAIEEFATSHHHTGSVLEFACPGYDIALDEVVLDVMDCFRGVDWEK